MGYFADQWSASTGMTDLWTPCVKLGVTDKKEKGASCHCMIYIYTYMYWYFVLTKKGSKTKKRMKEEEIEKGDCGPPAPKVFFFFEILSVLNQAIPNHLADESQTR